MQEVLRKRSAHLCAFVCDVSVALFRVVTSCGLLSVHQCCISLLKWSVGVTLPTLWGNLAVFSYSMNAIYC